MLNHNINKKTFLNLQSILLQFPMVEPDQYFAQLLSKFVSLNMRTLLVNGDWIMHMIVVSENYLMLF